MENVVDNFQTKEDLTYELADYKRLAIAQFRINKEEAKVLAANRTASTNNCMDCTMRNMRSNDILL